MKIVEPSLVNMPDSLTRLAGTHHQIFLWNVS